MSHIRTREMKESDQREVLSIYHEGIDYGNATFATKLPTWDEWNKGHIDAGRIVAVNENNEIIGFAALSKLRSLAAYNGFLELSIYVSNRAKRQGAGAVLMENVEIQAKKAGVWSIVSWIFSDNTPSIKLHEKAGYRVVGTHKKAGMLKGVWKDVLVMEKNI